MALLGKIRSIEGMLTDKEAALLYNLAAHGPGKGAIVEIGSYKGKSTACLALGSNSAGREKVHAVDWHQGWKKAVPGGSYSAFLKNMKRAGVSDYVVPVVMKSEEAVRKWKKPIRLLWIDGSHDYADVRKDFLLWSRFVIEGGVVVFHDSFWDGPFRVANRYLLQSGRFSKAGMADYIIFAVKTKPSKAGELRRNLRILALRKLLKYPMRAEHMHPKPINSLIKKALLNDFLQ